MTVTALVLACQSQGSSLATATMVFGLFIVVVGVVAWAAMAFVNGGK